MLEMSASETAMRKFLKQLGVTTHQKLEAALQARLKDGMADAGERLAVSAQIAIPELGFTHEIQVELMVPEADDSWMQAVTEEQILAALSPFRIHHKIKILLRWVWCRQFRLKTAI